MHVRVEMANPDQRIRPGMFGRMHIEVVHKPDTVVCLADALIRHGENCYVLREQGRNRGKYLLTRVSVGDRDDGRVEILDGLYPGQRVITTGTVELTALLNDAFAIADAKAAASIASQSSVVTPASWKPAAEGIRRVFVPGKIESATGRKQFAASTVTGRLASILVERGARVRRGDVLAEIDSLQLRNLQLDMLSAMVRLEFAEQSLMRLEKLKEDHQVDINRIWDLESSKRLMENKLATIASQLGLMGLEPDEIDRLKTIDPGKDDIYDQITTLLPMRAPADGWVVDFELGLGEVVNPQQRLFELQDLSGVWVHGYVRENDAGYVHVGQTVTVTVAGDPSFEGQGTIARTSPEVSPTDRVLDVWAELDNSQLRLREGMLATVGIEVDGAKEVRSQESGDRMTTDEAISKRRTRHSHSDF
jgi:multidrug efflux pump subunit AcrA (membrane-fusion protein)